MPLSTHEFKSYASRLSLCQAAINYVQETRASEPARSVNSSGSHNTIWRYPSEKMGFAVALESTEEYTYAAQLEYDSAVIEYWDQPTQVNLCVHDARGKRRRATYVPDFLILKDAAVEAIQVKPLSECIRLASSNPNRWTWDGRTAVDLAAAAHFREVGLVHRVVSDGHARKIFAENCLLLLRLRAERPHCMEARQLAVALRSLRKGEIFTLAQVMRAANTDRASEIVRLVDDGALFTDLHRCRLSVPHQCLLSCRPGIVEEHLLRLEEMELNADHPIYLTQAEGIEVHSRLLALRNGAPCDRSERTRRRWRACLSRAGGDPSGLRPRHSSKGNRLPRLAAAEIEVLDKSIYAHFLNADAISVQAAYSQYLLDHEIAVDEGALLRNSVAVSKEAFRLRCKRLPSALVAGARSGSRAAAAAATPVAPSASYLTPSRAFERAHTDHYQCDLHVIVFDSNPPITRKPWITALRDHATGLVLATSLSFSSPSNHSVLGVLRDCARRWGRLPETVVVDNGAEFHSTYFETTLASLRVSKQCRPPGEARFGGQIEGWFKSLKAFLSQQPGNTTNDEKGRAATAECKGHRRTTWTLVSAYLSIEKFIFGIYNNSIADARLCSRSQAATNLLAAYPESGVQTPFTLELLARTALPLPRPLKLDRARGIRHSARWYRHPKLFQQHPGRATFEAYVEPWDTDTLYVLIDGSRVPCRHGSSLSVDLTTDFTPALDSIRFLASAKGRTLLAKASSIEQAKLTRQFADADRTRRNQANTSKRPQASKARGKLPSRRSVVRPYGRGDIP